MSGTFSTKSTDVHRNSRQLFIRSAALSSSVLSIDLASSEKKIRRLFLDNNKIVDSSKKSYDVTPAFNMNPIRISACTNTLLSQELNDRVQKSFVFVSDEYFWSPISSSWISLLNVIDVSTTFTVEHTSYIAPVHNSSLQIDILSLLYLNLATAKNDKINISRHLY